jgi:hypothetical protein
MFANVYCAGCKQVGRRTVLEVELKGPMSELLFDAWCPVCKLPVSGRAFFNIPADDPVNATT